MNAQALTNFQEQNYIAFRVKVKRKENRKRDWDWIPNAIRIVLTILLQPKAVFLIIWSRYNLLLDVIIIVSLGYFFLSRVCIFAVVYAYSLSIQKSWRFPHIDVDHKFDFFRGATTSAWRHVCRVQRALRVFIDLIF